MPRPQTTPEQRKEARRKIRQAAADIYNAKGPGSLSIRTVAKQADVSVGTIYTYFGSLQGLMESLWNAPVAKYTKQLEHVAATIKDPKSRLRELMRSYAVFAQSNHEVYRSVFLFVRPSGAHPPEKKPAEEGIFASHVIQTIIDGQSRGQFKPGAPKEIALMIWGGLHGCLALPHNFGRLEFGDVDPVLEHFMDAAISLIEV